MKAKTQAKSVSTSNVKTPAAQLTPLYYNASLPSSYGGINNLAKASGLSRKTVKKWLESQWAYSLHKPLKRKFPHRRYVSRKMDMQWQADLVEMIPYARENQGYRYLMTVIDIFSRYAWAVPIKNKSAPTLLEAFKTLFNKMTEGRQPNFLQTDQGLEFENKLVREYLNSRGIEQFSIKSPHKAAMVERFNRTLKTRMWRAFTKQGSYEWLQLLPKLLKAYNASKHRTLGCAPEDVNKENESEIWRHLYGGKNSVIQKVRKKTKFKVGDRVRISKHKTIFGKGYTPNWTDEEFIVHGVNIKYKPTTYILRSLIGEIIEGSFYEQEMQLSEGGDGDRLYRISRILRTRGQGEHKQALVEWMGYGRDQASWIPYSELQKINNVVQ